MFHANGNVQELSRYCSKIFVGSSELSYSSEVKGKGQFFTILTPFLTPGMPVNGSRYNVWPELMLSSNFYHKKTNSLKILTSNYLFSANGQFLTILTQVFVPWGALKWVKIYCLTEMCNSIEFLARKNLLTENFGLWLSVLRKRAIFDHFDPHLTPGVPKNGSKSVIWQK